ncbi:MAG: ABC transporter ATP-binding protein [Bacteroidetes bacterium]|nr:ABC transporter ATP-binding protein [Bacteroidota bacterium]
MFGILFTLLSNYFRILSPQLSKFIIDSVAHKIQNNASAIETSNYNFLVKFIITSIHSLTTTQLTIVCGIILLLLAVLGGLFMFFMRQTIIVMSRHIEFDQKNELFKHYQNLDIEFFKTNSTGDLMNRMSEDVSKVRMYTGPSIMYIINLIGTIGFSLFFMFKENAILSLYVIAPLPILVIVIYYVNNIINHKSEQQQASLSSLTTIAQESYSGIRVIKSFVQEKITTHFFKEKTNEYKTNAIGLSRVEALYFPSIALLIGLSTIIAIYVGCKMHIQNPETVTAGTIAEFVIYVNMLTFPVSAIGLTASMIQRAAASQKRLNEFLEIVPSIQNNNQYQTPKTKQDVSLNYQLQNVSFTYKHSGIRALNNINLSILQKEKVFVLGNTGSGKSSLAMLLLRMYDCTDGNIFVNEEEISAMSLHSLRQNISYVPQDVFLFSDTIKNNIAFGSDITVDLQQIKNVAQIASIDNEIESLEKGYETLVGERGITLSGGQKQRISMARAFLKDVPFYIFDDCFSAVDNITEKKIGESLNKFLYNKSALFISHRIFKEFVFDKIIILDNGNIIEQGTHQQLLQLNGYYAQVFKKQMME